MADIDKTKPQLIEELEALRAQVAMLEHAEARRKLADETLLQECARVQKYLDIAGVILVSLNESGQITLINRKGREILGYSEGENLVGQSWFDTCLPERYREPAREVFDKLMAGEIEPVEHFENPILTKSGMERLIAWRNTVLTDDAGNITGTLSSGEDITERKQAEEQLGMLSLAIEQNTDSISILDPTGTIEYMNPKALELARSALEELIGKHWAFSLSEHSSLREDLQEIRATVLEQGMPWSGEVTDRARDGSMVWRWATITPIKNAEGELIHTVYTSQDITERRRAEEELKQRAAQLALINEVGRQIATVLSVDDVLDRAARLVHERFGYDYVSLLTVDRENGVLTIKARAGYNAAWVPDDYRFRISDGMVGWVARHGETLLANDVSKEPRYTNPFPGKVVRAELSVPIRVGKETVGILDVQSPNLNVFDANDVMVLETLAGQLAAAMHNAQLYEAERHERALAQTLQQTAEALTRSVSLENGLRLIINRLREVVYYDCVMVMVAEEDLLHVKVAHGFADRSQLPSVYSYSDHPAFHKIMLAGKEAVWNDVQQNPDWVALPGVTPSAGSWIGVPLIAKDIVVGFMSICHHQRNAYNSRDVEDVLAFAQQAALAIENAWVHTELETSLSNLRETRSSLLRAERLSAAGQLAAGVAHQVNNPLTTIIAQTHLLLKRIPLDDPYHEPVETIKRAAYQAGMVVQRLLDFAKSTPYVMQPVDVNLSIENSVALIRAQTDPRVAQFNVELAADLPMIVGSEQHLEDVWINLLLNARDAVRSVGGEGVITASTAFDAYHNVISVTVQDNGPGIPPEIHETIFSPFYTTKEHGTGLGLSICHDIVEHHNGTIHIESQEGHGTTFIVKLPVNQKPV